MGPYPVGFDTIAFYVPNTLDWAAGKAGFLEMLGTAPLMYMISVPAYLLLRVNPVWIFKAMGPILYGGMILALLMFLRFEPGDKQKNRRRVSALHQPEQKSGGGYIPENYSGSELVAGPVKTEPSESVKYYAPSNATHESSLA